MAKQSTTVKKSFLASIEDSARISMEAKKRQLTQSEYLGEIVHNYIHGRADTPEVIQTKSWKLLAERRQEKIERLEKRVQRLRSRSRRLRLPFGRRDRA